MTEKRYNEKLRELKERRPDSPFLSALERGYSAANVVYLQLAFDAPPPRRGAFAADSPSEAAEEKSNGITDLHIAAGDAVLIDLDEQRREWYRQLFATRKRLFDYPFTDAYNESRAAVSREVQGIQKQILRVKRAVDYYIENGHLPTNPGGESAEEFVLPTNPFELVKKQNSLAASLSRLEREIREAYGMGAAADGDRIKKKEKTLTRLRGQLRLVKEAILKQSETRNNPNL